MQTRCRVSIVATWSGSLQCDAWTCVYKEKLAIIHHPFTLQPICRGQESREIDIWHVPATSSNKLCTHYDHILLMEEIPNNHLGCIKPCKQWDKVAINCCRISSINSTYPYVHNSETSSLPWHLETFVVELPADEPSIYRQVTCILFVAPVSRSGGGLCRSWMNIHWMIRILPDDFLDFKVLNCPCPANLKASKIRNGWDCWTLIRHDGKIKQEHVFFIVSCQEQMLIGILHQLLGFKKGATGQTVLFQMLLAHDEIPEKLSITTMPSFFNEQRPQWSHPHPV